MEKGFVIYEEHSLRVDFPLADCTGSQCAGQEGGWIAPLIDRELIFGNPEIAGAQLSPNASTSRSSSRGRTRAMCM